MLDRKQLERARRRDETYGDRDARREDRFRPAPSPSSAAETPMETRVLPELGKEDGLSEGAE